MSGPLVARQRVVVIDDDQLYLRSLGRLFRGHADQVELVLCRTPAEVDEAVRSRHTDLAIVDYFMPSTDGACVCRSLKAFDEGLEVVLMSAALSRDVQDAARAAGADAIVPKPCDVVGLVLGRPPRPTRRPRRVLATEHLELARNIARRLTRTYRGLLSADDVLSAAMLGLCEAASRFEPETNTLFLAYAARRIRGAILDEVRRVLRDVPYPVVHMDEPTLEQVARTDPGTSPGIAPPRSPRPDDVLLTREALASLRVARAGLAPEAATVLELHYEHGHSLATIARELGQSETRVQQTHARALRALRRTMRRDGPA